MKLMQRSLGVPEQIWAVLTLLSQMDFSFEGAFGEGRESEAEMYDVHTHPFHNFEGRAHGFVTNVHRFNNNEFTLYFTITEHGSCDEICVIDWTGKREYRNPPFTSADRPEDARCVNFRFGDLGGVTEYVHKLVENFMTGKVSANIEVHSAVYVKPAGVV